MLTCEQAQNLMDAYLAGELSSSLTAELDAHLLECAYCQHQLTIAEACANVVRLDTSEPNVSDDFTTRLMAIIEKDQARQSGLQVGRRVQVAAIGLVGVAASLLIIASLPFFQTNAPSQEGRSVLVAGVDVNTKQTSSVSEELADRLLGIPLSEMMDAAERASSVIELGRLGISRLKNTQNEEGILPNDYPAYIPLNAHQQPELDIIDALPKLDDGGELM